MAVGRNCILVREEDDLDLRKELLSLDNSNENVEEDQNVNENVRGREHVLEHQVLTIKGFFRFNVFCLFKQFFFLVRFSFVVL